MTHSLRAPDCERHSAGESAAPNDRNVEVPCKSRRATPSSATPQVTVVIAAYNAEKFIRETLDSVAAQSLENLELIVVDDGSTDGTPAILRAFADRRFVMLRQDNKGVSAARNAGLAVARAPYIFFLDADDILLPDALIRMVMTLDRMPHHVACYAHHIRIAEDGALLSTPADLRWKLFPRSDTLRHLIAKNFIACGAICIRTDAARAVRGFDAALRLGEDWEFWCRLAVLGDFAAMDHVALYYRQRVASANYRLRTSPLRQNFEAIDAVFSNPAIQRKFPAIELKRRRRLAEIDAFWAGARNQYIRHRPIGFLRHLIVGVVCYPDSILRPRLVYLFLRGFLQHLSRPFLVRAGA